MRNALRSLGFAASVFEVESLIERFDVDGDGRIDYHEFIGFLFPSKERHGVTRRITESSDAEQKLREIIRRTARLDTWALRVVYFKNLMLAM